MSRTGPRTTYSAVMARWRDGYVYVKSAGAGTIRELYLELPNLSTFEEATAVAESYLDLRAAHHRTVALTGAVLNDSHVPGVGMLGGSFAGYAVAMDEDGQATVTPEMVDPLDVAAAAFERRINHASIGLSNALTAPNVNRQDTGSQVDTTPPPFSLDGPVKKSTSVPWDSPKWFQAAFLELALETPGDDPVTVRVNRRRFRGGGSTSELDGPSGSIMATLALPSGEERIIGPCIAMFRPTDRMTIEVVDDVESAEKLTVTVRGAMV